MDTALTLDGEILRISLPDLDVTSQTDIQTFREQAAQQIKSGNAKTISLALSNESNWNSLSLAILKNLVARAEKSGIDVDYSRLPQGAVKIMSLSRAPITSTGKGDQKRKFEPFFTVGKMTLGFVAEVKSFIGFIAASGKAILNVFRGKANFQVSDLKTFVHAAGPSALLIVGVVNLLLGVILAFMGAVQLQLFGAEIFVANLVALGHTREIAPMMTAIVLAGRTGAAYAAQLGTMQVNEEIDALTTFSFSPMQFLVLPRMLALALMAPLLVLYGDAIGIFGGYLIGVTMLDLGTLEYVNQTRNAISLGDITLGVFKGSIFGVLVAITGCREGMASGRSASAVGDAATRAVVNGILAIIIATAIFAVLTNWLGI